MKGPFAIEERWWWLIIVVIWLVFIGYGAYSPG